MKEFQYKLVIAQLERERDSLQKMLNDNTSLADEFATLLADVDRIVDHVSALRARVDELAKKVEKRG